jgi:nicotinamidase-related amidase
MAQALLIIDTQNYFLNHYTHKLPERIASFIQHLPSTNLHFFPFQFSPQLPFHNLFKESKPVAPEGPEIVKELQPWVTTKNVWPKSTVSCFKVPGFVKFCQTKAITDFFLCGFDTDGCITATAFEAFDRGWQVRIIRDLCASCQGDAPHIQALNQIRRNIKNSIVFSKDV